MPRLFSFAAPASFAIAVALGGTRSFRDHSAPPAAVISSAVAGAIAPNDNRAPAGALHGDTLTISLDVREGDWKPYGPTGPVIRTLAFGETGKALQTPGPMIRIKAGTRVHARVHNSYTATLVVHGLTAHRAATPDTLVVPAGATRDAEFTATDEGTYYYWGSTTGTNIADRKFEDAQLNGAFIVDSRTAKPKADRVFVVQYYLPKPIAPSTDDDHLASFFTFNGMPWPNSERLQYAQHDSIHWRIINVTADVHPLHLHGFYFRITARGDADRDTLYWRAQERMGVTELLNIGTTMDLSWYADRPGAWVFHCHLNWHVVPNPKVNEAREADSVIRKGLSSPMKADAMAAMAPMSGMANHSETGMGGLVMRVDIKPAADWKPYAGAREQLHLYILSDSQPKDSSRQFGYSLTLPPAGQAPKLESPGPVLVLHQGQPTTVEVVNKSGEPSQVHWHGLELDSYYDGVAGLSSNGKMVAPVIQPTDSFAMTVTPPRAGSFMYHTHINDIRQQMHGLYGPIIVLPKGAKWDPSSDLIFLAGSNGNDDAIMNGGVTPPALTVHPAKEYRVRLMNVTLDEPFYSFWLVAAKGPGPVWKAVAKDGFDLPAWQQQTGLTHQQVSIGETYDFLITFPAPGDYTMEGRWSDGVVFSRQLIHVVKAGGE